MRAATATQMRVLDVRQSLMASSTGVDGMVRRGQGARAAAVSHVHAATVNHVHAAALRQQQVARPPGVAVLSGGGTFRAPPPPPRCESSARAEGAGRLRCRR